MPSSIRVVNTVALVLLGIGYWFSVESLYWIASGLFLMTVLSAWLTDWFAFLWLRLGHALGYVNSRIILGLIFIFFLTPIAFLYRMFKKDPLQLKKNNSGSYFTVREHTFIAGDFEKMW